MSQITASHLPLYDTVFGSTQIGRDPYAPLLCSKPEELVGSIEKRIPDFSVTDVQEKRTLKEYSILFLKIICPLYWIYAGLRYLLRNFALMLTCPAQSSFVKLFYKNFRPSFSDRMRQQLSEDSDIHEKIVRHVVLERNGVKYSGTLITDPITIHNGNWLLQATGNAALVENHAYGLLTNPSLSSYNFLLINNPNVGRSLGSFSVETMGQAQELGIRFLETAVRAKNIMLSGFSLGGGAIGQAIMQHKFRKDINYTVNMQMTFDKSHRVVTKQIKQKWLRRVVKSIVRWTGQEIDTLPACRKLQSLNIPLIITQRGKLRSDEKALRVIPEYDKIISPSATLAYRVQKLQDNNKMEEDNIYYHLFPEAKHYPFDIIFYQNPVEEISDPVQMEFLERERYNSLCQVTHSLLNAMNRKGETLYSQTESPTMPLVFMKRLPFVDVTATCNGIGFYERE